MKLLLGEKDLWIIKEIDTLIREKFYIPYSERQIRRILKGFKMRHAKPYQMNYRKPENAEEKLGTMDQKAGCHS